MNTTPPATLVASTPAEIARAVDESVASEIANLGSPESRRSYECVWRYFRIWLMDQSIEVAPHQIKITAVRPKHISQYIASLRAEKKAKGTIGRALSVLRSLYAAIVRDELMQTNPAREVKGPKMDSTPKAPWIQNDADIQKLINVPALTWVERRNLTIVRLAFGLGWRRAEVARATVEDIKNGSISAIIKGGKNLTVGIPDWVAWSLLGWCAYAGIKSGPLFPRNDRDDRRPINGAIVYFVVRGMCHRAGIEVMPPHSLRRTYLTHAGLRKVSLRDRQYAVGHSSSNTTERYDKAGNTAASAVGNVFEDLT